MSARRSRRWDARLQQRPRARRQSPARRRERFGEDENSQAACGTGWRTNKPKGSMAGSRSTLIVLATTGNRGQRDPGEGSEVPYEQNHGRDT